MDTHASQSPAPHRLNQVRQSVCVPQKLLFLLVSVALFGMVIEACFIYRLYKPQPVSSSPTFSKIIAKQDVISTKSNNPFTNSPFIPTKPVAHLTDGQDAVSTKEMLAWSTVADPLLYEMDYTDRTLVIQKAGYYYVYSKLFFLDNGTFHHLVNQKTEKFSGKSLNLLQARIYSDSLKFSKKSNSFLGGVFYLDKGDAIFVEVSDTSKIMHNKPTENVFGAFMI